MVHGCLRLDKMTQKITSLKAQKRSAQRINVHLDGEFAFGISRIVAAWIEVGQELSPEEIKELQEKDSAEKSYQRALNFLSYRPRSQAEVIRNLRKHETPEGQIEETIERLLKNNLVNDQEFAQLWVENRSAFRPRGAYALRIELRQKGLSDDIIDPILNDLKEEELAYKAALQRGNKLINYEWNDFRKKLSGFLARRGFSYQIIFDTVSKVWEELGADIESKEVLK